MSLLTKIFGTHSERELKRIEGLVQAIEDLRPSLQALSDEELKGKTDEFKEFIKYHLSTCERSDLLGASAHLLDIVRK